MSLADSKVAKLRASCDGCNESKVRCSQTKPQCERCARLGFACVYGLSRRSHKTAPRVGATQTDLDSFMSEDAHLFVSRRSLETGGSTSSASSGRALADQPAGSTEIVSEVPAALQGDDAMATDGILLDPTTLIPNFDSYVQQLTSSSLLDLPMSFDPAFSPTSDPLTGVHGLLGQCLPPPKSSNKDGSSSDSLFDSGIPSGESHSPASVSCDCNSLIVKQLLSLPFRTEEENGALDTQLAQLKEAISVSEQCIGCACASRDDMSMSTRYLYFSFTSALLSWDDNSFAATRLPDKSSVHFEILTCALQ